jgi:hypothetical protein
MYEIQILRVNATGGVTRGKRRADTAQDLLHWVKVITGPAQSDTLIEFTVRTTASNEDG